MNKAGRWRNHITVNHVKLKKAGYSLWCENHTPIKYFRAKPAQEKKTLHKYMHMPIYLNDKSLCAVIKISSCLTSSWQVDLFSLRNTWGIFCF